MSLPPLSPMSFIQKLQRVILTHPSLSSFKKIVDKIPREKINNKIVNGNTLLHIVAEAGEFEMMNVLLEKNADLSIKNDYGETPIDIVNTQLENNLAIETNTKLRENYTTCLHILQYVSEKEKRI